MSRTEIVDEETSRDRIECLVPSMRHSTFLRLTVVVYPPHLLYVRSIPYQIYVEVPGDPGQGGVVDVSTASKCEFHIRSV